MTSEMACARSYAVASTARNVSSWSTLRGQPVGCEAWVGLITGPDYGDAPEVVVDEEVDVVVDRSICI